MNLNEWIWIWIWMNEFEYEFEWMNLNMNLNEFWIWIWMNEFEYEFEAEIVCISAVTTYKIIKWRYFVPTLQLQNKFIFSYSFFKIFSYHYHHHHHLFLKRPFLPCSARVRRSSRYEATPHIVEHCLFRVQTKLNHIILYTFSPSLPPSTRREMIFYDDSLAAICTASWFSLFVPEPVV